MKKKLIISAAIALLAALAVIPVTVYYATPLVPYAIAVSCVAGLVTFFQTGYREDILSAIDAVRTNSDALKGDIEKIKEVLASVTEEMATGRNERKSTLKELQEFIGSNHDQLIQKVSSIAAAQTKTLRDIKDTLLAAKYDSVGKLDEISALSMQIKNVISETGRLTGEMLESKAGAVTSLLTAVSGNVAKASADIISAMKTQELHILQSFDDIQKNQSESTKLLHDVAEAQAQSAKETSTSIKSFIDSHDIILGDIGATVKKVVSLQGNLENIMSDLESYQETLLKKVTATFQFSSNELIRQIKSSHEELMENMTDNLDKIQESLEFSVASIDDFSKKTSENINAMNSLIKSQDKRLETLGNYLPQLSKLNEAEERMMRDLAKICRSK